MRRGGEPDGYQEKDRQETRLLIEAQRTAAIELRRKLKGAYRELGLAVHALDKLLQLG